MSRTEPARQPSRSPAPHRRGRVIAAVAAVTILGVFVVVEVNTAGYGTTAPQEPSSFATSGTAAVGGVTVEGAEVAMGDVPLDVTVIPTWTLTNTSTETVSFGEPHASVIEGCCPGPLTIGMTELAPGESTELVFPLQMHEGMDGPHDFDVHVPVGSAGAYLTLSVTGTFG